MSGRTINLGNELGSTNIDDLLSDPRETLDVEVKGWLDLDDSAQRASLAKEIIALANHGGGVILIGFTELPDGTFETATARPTDLNRWSQDSVQDIVAKYLDPAVQCKVVHRFAAAFSQSHPVIVIPGGHRVPVRARSGSPDPKKLRARHLHSPTWTE